MESLARLSEPKKRKGTVTYRVDQHTPVRGPITLATFLRSQVFSVWRGAENAVIPGTKDYEFYGWRTLALDVRIDHKGSRPEFESRIVYANLSDETQPNAILRAVYWNNDVERARLAEEGMAYRLGLPARFVWVPTAMLNSWIETLHGVSTDVNVRPGIDPLLPVRRLLVKMDYKICVFEKVWRYRESPSTALDLAWDGIWNKMGDALSNGTPSMSRLDEAFEPSVTQPFYDLESYLPNRWDRP